MQTNIIHITGPNASGKTQRMELLRRGAASERLRYLAFSDAYGPAVDGSYYLQQRWNQHDIDPEMPLVGSVLQRSYSATGHDTDERRAMRDMLYELFGLNDMLGRYVISLSSGELRKLQLTKVLMAEPETLILDNPFIGLDAITRRQLSRLLEELSAKLSITIYLVEPTAVGQERPVACSTAVPCSASRLPAGVEMPAYAGSEVVAMHDINIAYDGHTILRLSDWQVERGQHWAITGRNGSGKSTLLSLICGDNPQAYACDIRLFGQQRGTGETIWQLKRRIGYVSPEMHRAYRKNLPSIWVVASGLKDTIGLYVRPTAAEEQLCMGWMELFGVSHLARRPFLQISSGEQRMVLLARAFVKDPLLLILDEPMHGLDPDNCQRVKDITCRWAARNDRTLLMVSHSDDDFPPLIDHRLTLGSYSSQ
ncbi:MAG: ATP-binding cassette domain-containing protein [Prevotella sp.]|nr:ATP-binding cassette domain-containing protein [Prevotella sp.]